MKPHFIPNSRIRKWQNREKILVKYSLTFKTRNPGKKSIKSKNLKQNVFLLLFIFL